VKLRCEKQLGEELPLGAPSAYVHQTEMIILSEERTQKRLQKKYVDLDRFHDESEFRDWNIDNNDMSSCTLSSLGSKPERHPEKCILFLASSMMMPKMV
jgi:hypothetical protein